MCNTKTNNYTSAVNSCQLRLLNLTSLVQALYNDPDLAHIDPNLRPQILQTLFVVSGCDYISFFSRLGKATFLRYFYQYASFISSGNQTNPGTLADVARPTRWGLPARLFVLYPFNWHSLFQEALKWLWNTITSLSFSQILWSQPYCATAAFKMARRHKANYLGPNCFWKWDDSLWWGIIISLEESMLGSSYVETSRSEHYDPWTNHPVWMVYQWRWTYSRLGQWQQHQCSSSKSKFSAKRVQVHHRL